MLGAALAFAFATLGSKLLLGLAIVYAFLPDVTECSICDGRTSAIEPRRGLRAIAAALGIQSRWCPACGETFLARGRRPPRLWVGAPEREPVDAPRSPAQVLERRVQ